MELLLGNYKGVVCKFCRAKQFVTNAARMARHIMRCPSAPCHVKKLFQNGKSENNAGKKEEYSSSSSAWSPLNPTSSAVSFYVFSGKF
jgi:hypothetical protein